MKRKILLSIILVVLIFGSLPVMDAYAYAPYTYSGTISLPDGKVAPPGGIYVYAVAYQKDGYSAIGGVGVTMPEGQRSVEFSIPVYELHTSCYLSYRAISGYESEYIETGYYSSNGMVENMESAILLEIQGGSLHNINLSMIPIFYKSISGAVSLPSGQVATQDITVQVCGYVMQPSGYAYQLAQTVVISAGSSSAPYKLRYRNVNNEYQYYLSYSILDQNKDYVGSAYYSSGGMVLNLENVTMLSLNQGDLAGIDLTLIRRPVITGKISLPNGKLAPQGGLSIVMIADPNGTQLYLANITIPGGQNSIPFEVHVDPGRNYELSYNVDDGNYMSEGYYNTGGMQLRSDKATLVSVNDSDVSEINMTLVPSGLSISGTLSLPNGETAPRGGIFFRISVNGITSVGYTIPEGQNSIPYKVNVQPTIGDVQIQYDTYPSYEGYYSTGYYHPNGTVRFSRDAYVINVSCDDITGVNFEIKKDPLRTISGTIRLPQGDAAPAGGVEFDVIAHSPAALYARDYTVTTRLRIEGGQNAAPYEFRIPESLITDGNTHFYISYSQSFNQQYAGIAYYSTSGTVLAGYSPTKIDLTKGNVSGIDLTFIRNVRVSGMVSLPNGRVAPPEGIKVELESIGSTIVILGGYSSANYSALVPPYYSMTMKYSTNSNGLASTGYYSTAGTTFDPAKATILQINNQDVNNINLVLIPAQFIRGTVSLPEGRVAPAGGFQATIYAYYEKMIEFPIVEVFQSYIPITFPEGSSSQSYTLQVDPMNEYLVFYGLDSAEGYISSAYYHIYGTNSLTASKIAVGFDDVSNINMTILTPETNKMLGDCNGDMQINIEDLIILALAYESNTDSGHWNSKADFTKDGIINLLDLGILAAEYNK